MRLIQKYTLCLFDITSRFPYNNRQVLLYPTIQTNENCIIAVTFLRLAKGYAVIILIGLGLENKE